MAKLCSHADVICPNITEATLLLDKPFPGDDYDEKYIRSLMEDLAKLGSKKVILKGVGYKKDLCGVITFDSITGTFTEYFHELIPAKFHGTGDIFASVAFSALVLGKTIDEAVRLAADFTVLAIKKTVAHTDHNFYGVDFEAAFPWLIQNLQ